MGSKEEDVPKEPIEKPVFVEDMNDSELASAVSIVTKLSFSFLTSIYSWNFLVDLQIWVTPAT